MNRIFQGSFSIIVILLAWQGISSAGVVPAALFPPPTKVVEAWIEMVRSGELIKDVQSSLWRAVVGFVLGSAIAILIGLVTGRISLANNYLSPVIQLLRPLPPVAIIPLVILWFGIGEISKLFSIAFAVFFPVWINTHVGVRDIPKTFLWSARTLKVTGFSILWKVIFPASLPFVVAGLRTGISIAFIMVFVSELAGASSGIGYQIYVSQLAYRMDRMMAALVLLGLLGAIADIGLIRFIGQVFPWLKFLGQK
ncbi:MAG: ABC transporter permease [Symploca sp. SIO1C2]|nr:ABC transporter permease [Symploca sp. SIO1C2]